MTAGGPIFEEEILRRVGLDLRRMLIEVASFKYRAAFSDDSIEPPRIRHDVRSQIFETESEGRELPNCNVHGRRESKRGAKIKSARLVQVEGCDHASVLPRTSHTLYRMPQFTRGN